MPRLSRDTFVVAVVDARWHAGLERLAYAVDNGRLECAEIDVPGDVFNGRDQVHPTQGLTSLIRGIDVCVRCLSHLGAKFAGYEEQSGKREIHH
ncbi:hypothetical protein BMS3Abin02_00649 [bacterium BMS3Abin02]|nr:hypothetical protein BMS3Abin02_00649 [bacterium BMS3Abin02]